MANGVDGDTGRTTGSKRGAYSNKNCKPPPLEVTSLSFIIGCIRIIICLMTCIIESFVSANWDKSALSF